MQWSDMFLALGSIILAGLATLLLKNVFKRYRRPNGRKGGIVSFQTTIAFATVTVVALSTRDWFLTALTVILAYFIARSRVDENQHHLYQVVISAVLGIGIPYALYYLWGKRKSRSDYRREEITNKPERVRDDRDEADKMPELRLDDDETEIDDLPDE